MLSDTLGASLLWNMPAGIWEIVTGWGWGVNRALKRVNRAGKDFWCLLIL